MKRRIQLIENGMGNVFPADSLSVSKFVHCVESDDVPSGQSNVVIEWGPSEDGSSLDMLFRYRCGAFPDAGSFYLIIYNDPYQSQLHEVRLSVAVWCDALYDSDILRYFLFSRYGM